MTKPIRTAIFAVVAISAATGGWLFCQSQTGSRATPPKGAPGSPPAVAPVPEPKVVNGLTRGPYLQLATQDSIRVVWRCREEMKPVVKFGEDAKNLDQHVGPVDGIVVRMTAAEAPATSTAKPLFAAPKRTTQYEALVSGLKPDTKYFYAICNGEKRLTPEDESYYFRTLPVVGADRPAWMWVAGDGGTGGRIQAAVHQAMVDFTSQHKVSLDMFLHVGDMAYNSGLDSEFQGRFFEMYDATLRNTVCWPAMGNHEGRTSKGMAGVGPYYDCYVCPTKGEAGGLPSGREAYYSFDFGRIHFIVLDSCDESVTKKGKLTPLGEEMMEWLKADLEKAKADWLIAYWHHPPYTKGSHDSDSIKDFESIEMREKFLPVLESAGVDVVLSGHSHIYERSMFMDGAYATPTTAANVVLNDGDGDPNGDGAYQKAAGLNPNDGAVYVVTGNAGTTLKRMGTMPVMKRIILEHGSVLLYVHGDSLRGLMLNKDGQRRDNFEITKKGNVVARTRITSPKPAPGIPSVRQVKADGTAAGIGDDEPKSGGAGSAGPGRRPIALPGAAAPPADATPIIDRGAEWKYFTGDPPADWTQGSFDDIHWAAGPAGIGYGDNDDATDPGMEGKHTTVYLRKQFSLKGGEDLSKMLLCVSFDDAFIAYLNGHEIARSPNITGTGKLAKVAKSHEAALGFISFPLDKDKVKQFIKPGVNVLAVEGHNDDIDSSDFSLHPSLLLGK